jgi:hypothetical protein
MVFRRGQFGRVISCVVGRGRLLHFILFACFGVAEYFWQQVRRGAQARAAIHRARRSPCALGGSEPLVALQVLDYIAKKDEACLSDPSHRAWPGCFFISVHPDPHGEDGSELIMDAVEALHDVQHAYTVRACPGRLGALSAFHNKLRLCTALLYGRAGRLTAHTGGFRPGQMYRQFMTASLFACFCLTCPPHWGRLGALRILVVNQSCTAGPRMEHLFSDT